MWIVLEISNARAVVTVGYGYWRVGSFALFFGVRKPGRCSPFDALRRIESTGAKSCPRVAFPEIARYSAAGTSVNVVSPLVCQKVPRRLAVEDSAVSARLTRDT